VETTEPIAPSPTVALAPTAYAGLAVGVALFTGLIAYQGVKEVGSALAVAGPGLMVVALFHLGPMLADALGWRTLVRTYRQLPVRTMLWARWIGESVNALLPVMQVGGNVVKARLLVDRGLPGAAAGASVVVDVTLVMLTQILFTVLGLGLLVAHVGGERVAAAAAVGTVIVGALLAGFYVVQRRGLFGGLARMFAGAARRLDWSALTTGAAVLDESVAGLYRERRAIGASSAWHLASWIMGTGEVWLALYFLGHPVSVLPALLLESLGQAVRVSAFIVPGALGVQEGGYLVLGTVLGFAPETSLALSLAKRVRELVLGLTGLVVWQAGGAAAILHARGAGRGEAGGS
jgi:putative membrane protein